MNLVLIGSFADARRIDSRATASVTPSTSNNTVAGRITATHDSTPPLPVPMRTSAGFAVTGFGGTPQPQGRRVVIRGDAVPGKVELG